MRVGRRTTKAAGFLHRIRSLFTRSPELVRDAHPNFVKAQIPPSSFTQNGPGVRAQLRRALWKMTPAQRAVAKRKSWDKGLLS